MYSFGIPGYIIWSLHILLGLFLAYVGYLITFGQKVPSTIGIFLIIVGSLMIVYHAHLWFIN